MWQSKQPTATANVSIDVLSTWELSATPLEIRIEHLYIGESAESIQKFARILSSPVPTLGKPKLSKQSSTRDTEDTKFPQDDGATSSSSSLSSGIPVILGLRTVAQLVMENKRYCDPLVSDLGYLEIIPKKSSPELQPQTPFSPESHLLVSASMPCCYTVNFSSVFTFPLNICDLSLDSHIEFFFTCVDLGVEIGRISFQVFSTTGVLRQGRFLLPFGLTQLIEHNDAPPARSTPSLHSRACISNANSRGVCAHCAASSRYVSRLGCLGECSDSNSEERQSVDDSVISEDDHYGGTYSLSCDSSGDGSNPEIYIPSSSTWSSNYSSPAQSILSMFLGDRKSKHSRRICHRASKLRCHVTNPHHAESESSENPSQPHRHVARPREKGPSNDSSQCTTQSSTDSVTDKSILGSNSPEFHHQRRSPVTISSRYLSPNTSHDLPSSPSTTSSSQSSSCILISSGSLSSWSSASSADTSRSPTRQPSENNDEQKEVSEDGASQKHSVISNSCSLSVQNSSPQTSKKFFEHNGRRSVEDDDDKSSSSSFVMISSGSKTARRTRRMVSRSGVRTKEKSRRGVVTAVAEEQKTVNEAQLTATVASPRKRRNKGCKYSTARQVQSFRRVSKCVYRAMNCYKLLDLSKRGVVAKCPYTKDVCRVQIQLQCERNLVKSLAYFGFVTICLPIFPTPVVFSTTPPQRSLPEDLDDTHKQQLLSKASTWLTGGASWPLLKSPLGESSGASPAEITLPRKLPCRPPIKRPAFAYVPPSILLEQQLNWKQELIHKDDFDHCHPVDGDLGESSDHYEDPENVCYPLDNNNRQVKQLRRRYSFSDDSVSYTRREQEFNEQVLADECAQWYLEMFEVSSWQSRRSLLAMAHNIVVQNSIHPRHVDERSSPMKRQILLNAQRPDSLDGPRRPPAVLTTLSERSSSVPSLNAFSQRVSSMEKHPAAAPVPLWPSTTSLPASTRSTLRQLAPPWVPFTPTVTSLTRQQQRTHQMKLLQNCWSAGHSNFYLRDQQCPLERLYLKQQRQLAISAMDRQRALDESALDEGRCLSGIGGLSSSLSPPQVSEYQLLDATLALSNLTPADKRLLWRHRTTLKTQGVSVLKLAAAVDWMTTQQPKEFNELLETWPLPSIEGALELLSSLSPTPSVRHFACRALDAASDSDICRYLPQLVQAIRYDVPGPNAPVLSVLLRRASICPRIASALHWSLQCETEDSDKAHLFIRGNQRLLETLAKTPEGSIGRRIMKILELQRRFAVALRGLATQIRDRKDRADRKTERLRELLVSTQLSPGTRKLETSDSLQLTNLQQPVPLPISPYGLLLGIVPEKSHVVKSSQYPLVLACRVLVPPSYRERTDNDSENTSSIRPIAVEYPNDDSDEIHDLWGQEIIDVSLMKEKGYKEILKKYLFKSGDDLRQDQLVTQIIRIIKDLLAEYGSDYRLTLYDVVALSRTDGLVEFVEKSEAISSIKKSYPTLRHYFAAYSAESNGPLGFPKSVLETFIRSCSGYSVITFLLGVGDRHLDNLLLCEDGRLFHVDFGFILGDDPKPFPPPMKLCSEMIEGLGGIGSEGYTTFQLMCCQCFRCIRRHSKLILDALLMMTHSGIRALRSDSFNTVARVQEKFQLELPEVEAEAFLLDIIDVSANALFPAVVDKFHEWALYWK